jgi:hypothetical protein
MTTDERAGGPGSRQPPIEPAETFAVETQADEDRPTAPDDPRGTRMLDDLTERIAELDAVAWNIPTRRRGSRAPRT